MEERWFEKDSDKQGLLRVFFKNMIYECIDKNTSCDGIFKYRPNYMSERPFNNAFRINGKNNRVFTNTIISNFILLCMEYAKQAEDIEITTNIEKALNMIQTKYNLTKSSAYLGKATLNCEGKKLKVCLEQIASLRKEYLFDDNNLCPSCSVCCLYKSLRYIEGNYQDATTPALGVSEVKLEKDNLTLIDKAFQLIEFFEKKDGIGLYDTTSFVELFNACMACYEIPDALNKKLAYVKWYVAHMANWPYVKYYLSQLNHYDEEVVFQLHRSASKILHGLVSTDEKLQSQVECDRLISYLSLGYARPFSLPHYERPDEMIKECQQIANGFKPSKYKLSLYIELWNFQCMIDASLADTFETEIDDILKSLKNDDAQLLKARYRLYQYIHYPSADLRDKAEAAITAAYNQYRKIGTIPENLDFLAELFLHYFETFSPSDYANRNPCLLSCNVKGCGDVASVMYPVLQAPSHFQRIFGDNVIPEYYKLQNTAYAKLYEKES